MQLTMQIILIDVLWQMLQDLATAWKRVEESTTKYLKILTISTKRDGINSESQLT
jgi:hypothetical protein